MAVITALRTEKLAVPLPAPIMSGLGPITTTGVLLVFLDTDQGVIGENLVFTLNNKRLAVIDEMVRSLEPYRRTWTDRPTAFACRWFAR